MSSKSLLRAAERKGELGLLRGFKETRPSRVAACNYNLLRFTFVRNFSIAKYLLHIVQFLPCILHLHLHFILLRLVKKIIENIKWTLIGGVTNCRMCRRL
jgi:hypothetical protein